MIFEGFASKEKIKQNPRKSSKNHQKIIVLLEKNQENMPKSCLLHIITHCSRPRKNAEPPLKDPPTPAFAKAGAVPGTTAGVELFRAGFTLNLRGSFHQAWPSAFAAPGLQCAGKGQAAMLERWRPGAWWRQRLTARGLGGSCRGGFEGF